MNIEETKLVLSSYIGQKQNELMALEVIKDLFTNGYNSDQVYIKQEIESGVSSCISSEKAPLEQEILSLTNELNVLKIQDSENKAKITALEAKLGETQTSNEALSISIDELNEEISLLRAENNSLKPINETNETKVTE